MTSLVSAKAVYQLPQVGFSRPDDVHHLSLVVVAARGGAAEDRQVLDKPMGRRPRRHIGVVDPPLPALITERE
jgi:hypothetical protein